ncbi:uncharacterized protein JCM6883_002397 [Sporobolomyces salmoneus]|uniref:uncharacterized protein n=1 Tax=Sporobolomyces salmoneus TaxID=183962 RepID=UPI003177FC95
MSIQSLPNELLRSIIHYSVPYHNIPFQLLPYVKNCKRVAILDRLSLVHRSWTPLAQELLFKEMSLYHEDDEIMLDRAEQLLESRKTTGRKFKPKTLRVRGDLGILLDVTKGEEIWSRVENLEHVNQDSVESLDIYSHFPSLKTLCLHARYDDTTSPTDSTISLPHLERFELHYPEAAEDFEGDPEDGPEDRVRPVGLQRFDLPTLKHLLLDVRYEDSLEWIQANLGKFLKQIEILDIRANLDLEVSTVTILNHPELFSDKLKHLAIWYRARDQEGDMNFFSWEKKGFDLQTFLLKVEPPDYDDTADDYVDQVFETVDRLGKIARGEFEGIRAKRCSSMNSSDLVKSPIALPKNLGTSFLISFGRVTVWSAGSGVLTNAEFEAEVEAEDDEGAVEACSRDDDEEDRSGRKGR